MDEIEQLRSDLENAVLERDKALAEATGILQALDATTAENLRMRAAIKGARSELGPGDGVIRLREDRDRLRDECARLLAGLKQFREVTITRHSSSWGSPSIEVDNEWALLPLKVYVKDDHA